MMIESSLLPQILEARDRGLPPRAIAKRFRLDYDVLQVWLIAHKDIKRVEVPAEDASPTPTKRRKRKYKIARVDPSDPLYAMTNRGVVSAHRLALARKLGRRLARWESVHHIDGDPSNNDVDNLQLRHGPHGSGQVFQCRSCLSLDIVAVGV